MMLVLMEAKRMLARFQAYLLAKPETSPQPERNPLLPVEPAQQIAPSESLPLVKLVLPSRVCSNWRALGFHISGTS